MGVSDAKDAPGAGTKGKDQPLKSEPKSETKLDLASVSDKPPVSSSASSSAADTKTDPKSADKSPATVADQTHPTESPDSSADRFRASFALLKDTPFFSPPNQKPDAALTTPLQAKVGYPYPNLLLLADYVEPAAPQSIVRINGQSSIGTGSDSAVPLMSKIVLPVFDQSAGSPSIVKTNGDSDENAGSDGQLNMSKIVLPVFDQGAIESAKPAEAKPEARPEITEAQRGAFRDVEAQMTALMPNFVGKSDADGPADKAVADARKVLQDDDGKFGTPARELYGRYLTWMQTENAPTFLRQLEMRGLPMPPGAPPFKSDTNPNVLPGTDLSAPTLRADLGIDPNKIPDRADAIKLEGALSWMIRANTDMRDATQKVMDTGMVQDLKSLGFSEAFMPKADTDMTRWRQDTAQTLDMARDMRRYGEAIKALRDAGYDGKLPISFPPGVTEGPGGKLNYDLPTEPRPDTVENQSRMLAMSGWKAINGDRVDQTLMRVELAKLNPNKILQWGDIELRDQDAVFSKDGQFQSLAKSGAYTAKPGETVEHVNLLQNRFSTRTEKDASGNDVIVVSQEVQANQVADWGYQNLIGVTPVGQSFKPAEQRYKPEDFVPISTSDGMKLIQARDLGQYKFMQEVEHYGGKSLIGVMDGAMAVTAVIGVGEVIAGARLLVAGAEVAGNVLARDLALQGAKMGLRLTVAAAGVFNNAGANETAWGRRINEYRGYYFMADIGLGVGRAGFSYLRKGVRAAESAGENGGSLLTAPRIAEATDVKVPREVTLENGVVKAVKTETGLLRTFEYADDAAGKPAISELKVGTGADTITMKRTGDHQWSVQKGTARATTLEGDIAINQDGSYTVKYLTDERASWYQKAYEKGPPSSEVERSVTYNLDGTATAKGLEDTGFTPAEGSTFTKNSRAGEYWSSPDGRHTWIDGQKHLWEEAGPGVWTTKTAVLTEERDWVKAIKVYPTEVTEPTPWVNTNGNGAHMIAEPGSWKMPENDGSGRFYVVPKETFWKSYAPVPGEDGAFVKTAVTKARMLDRETTVDSESGVYKGGAGDYLVTTQSGDSYIMPGWEFDKIYAPAAAGKTAEPFKLPTPTGDAKALPNGVVETPWQSGKILWDAKNSTVTVSDTVKGTSETFLLENKSGAFFSFSDGTKVRITPAGLRMVHEPKDPAGLFKGEDGSVFTEATQSTVPIVGDKSPIKYGKTVSSGELLSDREHLPGAAEKAPAVEAAGNPMPGVDAAGNKLVYSDSGTMRIAATGEITLTDTRGRVWQKTGDSWSNENGTYKVDAQGRHWDWKDGSGDWIDSENRVYSRTPEMEKGTWRSADGATYKEGSWRYTPRTKDDLLPESIYRSAAFGEVVAGRFSPDRSTSSQRMDAFIESQMEKSAWLNIANKGTTWAFKATEYGMLPQIAGDNFKELKRIFGEHKADTLTDAWQFLPEGPGMRIAKAGDFDPKNADALNGASDMLSQYGNILSSHRRPEIAGQVQDIMHRTIEVMKKEAAGDPKAAAAKAGLIADLTKQEQFTEDEIYQLNSYMRSHPAPDGSMQGRNLSGADWTSLYAGKVPDWVDADRAPVLQKLSDSLLRARNSDVQTAREIALLYLNRDADGKLPATLGQANLKLLIPPGITPSYLPPDFRYDDRVQLSTDAMLKRLSTAMSPDVAAPDKQSPRSMVVGDVLTRLGAMSHAQYAGVLKDVLDNPNSSPQDKIQALVGGQSIDFATLTAEVRASESSAQGRPGASSKELIKSLEDTAKDTRLDPEVRALAAMLRYGLEPENMGGLPALIAAARKSVGPSGQIEPGSFSQPAIDFLSQRATGSPDGTAVDDTELYARLSAARSLNMLHNVANPKIAQTAAESFASIGIQAEDPQLKAKAYAELSSPWADQVKPFKLGDASDLEQVIVNPTMFDALQKSNPQLAEKAMNAYLDGIDASLKSFASGFPESRKGSEKLLQSAMDLSKNMTPEQTARLASSLVHIYSALRTSKNSADDHAKEATLFTIAQLDRDKLSDQTIQVLKTAADSDPVKGEASAGIRNAAIALLNSRGYEHMPELIDTLSKTETDPAVLKTYNDFRFAYAQKESRAAQEKLDQLASESDKVQTQYLPGFDAAAQSKWIHDKYPLLLAQDYETTVKAAGDDSMSRIARFFSFESTIEQTGLDAMRVVAAERDRQFSKLAQLALMPEGSDKNSVDESNRAKAVLYSIIRAQGVALGSNGNGAIPWRSHQTLANSTVDPLMNDTYRWRAMAADALAVTAQKGVVGSPLVESYLRSIVAHPGDVPAVLRYNLLNAWVTSFSPIKQLTDNPSAGSSFISMSQFYSTLKMSRDAEKARLKKQFIDNLYDRQLERVIGGLPGNLSQPES